MTSVPEEDSLAGMVVEVTEHAWPDTGGVPWVSSAGASTWVIAEGVGNEGQLTALARLGVPLAQEWLLGRPGADWPTLADPDLVRERIVVGAVSEPLVSLIAPLPADYLP